MKPVEEMTHEELVARYKLGNPFAVKAARARAKAIRFSRPSEHEAAMAQSFPLGAGFGRPNDAKRIDASVNKAKAACESYENAKWLESKAHLFDEGKINAQGRHIDKFSIERSIKRESQQEAKEARIAQAKAEMEGKELWQVTGETYATAAGYMRGSARELLVYEHTEVIQEALKAGKPVPPDVLEWYNKLAGENHE